MNIKNCNVLNNFSKVTFSLELGKYLCRHFFLIALLI